MSPTVSRRNLAPGSSDTISSIKAAPIRIRRCFWRTCLTNKHKTCVGCTKKIKNRQKHQQCTQCRARYHIGCIPLQQAMCQPPPFGCPAAAKRVAPPKGSNMAAAVEFSSTSAVVPGIVEDLIAVLDSRGMDVEGVFRVPGNKDRINEILIRYWDDRDKRLGVYTVKNVHDCSSALKQFLRDLDEPLTTYRAYDKFIESTQLREPQARLICMIAALEMLPLYNLMTLKLLMQHLHRLAAAVEITRMKFSNIAAIFAPTLLQSPLGDSENLRDVMMQMRCVDMLLKLEEDVWEDVAAIAVSADVRTSASPLPGRKGGDSPKRQDSIGQCENPP